MSEGEPAPIVEADHPSPEAEAGQANLAVEEPAAVEPQPATAADVEEDNAAANPGTPQLEPAGGTPIADSEPASDATQPQESAVETAAADPTDPPSDPSAPDAATPSEPSLPEASATAATPVATELPAEEGDTPSAAVAAVAQVTSRPPSAPTAPKEAAAAAAGEVTPTQPDDAPASADTAPPVSTEATAAPSTPAQADAANAAQAEVLPTEPAPGTPAPQPAASTPQASAVAAVAHVTPLPAPAKPAPAVVNQQASLPGPTAGKVTSPGKGGVSPPQIMRARTHEPWLQGTYKTPKGRIISGQELCQSLERMTNAYVDKYMAQHDHNPIPHPGTSAPSVRKTLPPEELDSMISRLYQVKNPDEAADEAGKLEHVQLKFGAEGKEEWVPVKKVSYEEQKEYMCELYQRCLDQKQKTKDELAAKYLQPLGKPRKV